MRFFICIFIVTSSLRVFAADSSSLKSPSVSGNALFLYRNSNFHKDDVDPTLPDSTPNGFNVQETELQFYSEVDPYSRLNILVSAHPEWVSDGTQVSESWVFEPEELYAETISVPNWILKIGKFKAFFGRHNQLHAHAYPFIEAPLVNTFLLGEEGLSDAGISAAYLLPTSWFSELTLQYLRGQGENTEFNSPSPSDGLGLGHWKNLVDLTEDLTCEIGLSYAEGKNSYRDRTQLEGIDLTFKWRPSQGGLYHSWIWSSEWMSRQLFASPRHHETGEGASTFVQYQWAERWAALARYDMILFDYRLDPLLPEQESEQSLAVLYFPSEFSSFKVEFNQRQGTLSNKDRETAENALLVQANFTIGAHPAHSY